MDEQTAQTGQTQEGASEAPSIDNAALLSRMDELAGEIKGLRDVPAPQYEGGISEALSQPAGFDPASDEYANDFEYGQGDPQGFDQFGPQPDQAQAMEQLQRFIEDQAKGIAKQEVTGVQQQMQQYIHSQEVARLEQKYPALNDPKVVGPLVEEAQRFAQQLGQPGLATSPAMIEKLYLAQQASARAAQETPADGDQEVHLEGGGAGQPAPPEDDLVSRVVNAGGADASARAFWT